MAGVGLLGIGAWLVGLRNDWLVDGWSGGDSWFGRLVGWLVHCFVDWPAGWLVARLHGCSVARLLGWLVGWGWWIGVGDLVDWMVGGLVDWLVGWY